MALLNPLCYMFVLYFIYFCSHIHFFLHSTFFGFILLFLFLFCNHWDGCLVNSFLPIPFLFYFLFFNFFFYIFNKGFIYSECISQSVSSVAQSCPTLCDPMGCRMSDLPVHHQLHEFTQIHVHYLVKLSNHLILCCPFLLPPPIFSSLRVFSNKSALCLF